MSGLLSYGFMQNALLAGVLVSLACGVIGTLVVLKRMVFISGGVAHTAYGGVGLAFYLGVNPILGAVVFSLLASFLMGYIQRKTHQRQDTLIGVMWAIGMAVGIIFAGRPDELPLWQHPGSHPNRPLADVDRRPGRDRHRHPVL